METVAPVAAKGGSLPILQNILLEAAAGTLRLKATNLEIGVTAEVRGKIEQEGSFTVSGRLFADYVRLLPADSKVDMVLEGDHLSIRAAGQQTKIHGLSAEEFPVIPTFTPNAAVTLGARYFRQSLHQVIFAASFNDARPEISGILIKVEGANLTLVGTDSYRLAEARINLAGAGGSVASAIVPLRTMQELGRILGQNEGDLTLAFNDNQVLFSVGDVELISRLVTGNYPDYVQIIPTMAKTTVVLEKEPLARAIKSASLFCRSGLNHVTLQFSQDKILVSASSSSVGENIIEVPAKVEGADTDIVFDYRFILDGLAVVVGSELTIKLTGATSPGVFTSQEAGYLYLVMPIKQ